MAEKTEQPTPKRLRDARRKGQVAKSKEVTSAATLVGAFIFLWLFSSQAVLRMKAMLLYPASLYGTGFGSALGPVLEMCLNTLIFASIPIALASLILAVFANFFQIGLLISFEPVKPNLSNLDPFKGIKRIFSKNNLIELIKSAVKITFLSVLLYMVMKSYIEILFRIPDMGVASITMVLSSIMKKIFIMTSIAFITVAAVDYFWQKKQYIKKLMMTKEEVKQEYKEMEGDPLIKSKRRQLHRELLLNDTLQRTKKATVIITNPTRIAVALYYEKGKTKLPVVVAKGENLIAKRMLEIAREEGIPVVQNVPLAQALYEHVDINQYIPSELIEPTAEVLKWVMKLRQSQE